MDKIRTDISDSLYDFLVDIEDLLDIDLMDQAMEKIKEAKKEYGEDNKHILLSESYYYINNYEFDKSKKLLEKAYTLDANFLEAIVELSILYILENEQNKASKIINDCNIYKDCYYDEDYFILEHLLTIIDNSKNISLNNNEKKMIYYKYIKDTLKPFVYYESAKDLIYSAYDSKNVKDRVIYAYNAIEISKLCVDAYCVLAQNSEYAVEDPIYYYTKAVYYGFDYLGDKFVKENKGHFWGIHITRSLMYAMNCLADEHLKIGNLGIACNFFEKMLMLNPNDNQGVRYSLINLYIELNELDLAEKLIDFYETEYTAHWFFSVALVAILKNDKNKEHLLQEAINNNIHVSKYLLKKKKIPRKKPNSYVPGDESEAILYCCESSKLWFKNKEAISLLNKLSSKQETLNL